MRISIIGAGPAGNYLAYLLAKSNYEVNVIEEHKTIGQPIQCTGIITSSIENIIPLKKEFIANKITNFKIIAPNNNSVEFNFKKPNYIIHRDKFDKYLANLAKKAGAKYNLNTKYLSNTKNTITTKSRKTTEKQFDILIGADGPNSLVARNNNLFKKREFTMGQQVTAKLNLPKNQISIYLGVGEFAWIVPEKSNIFRIGLVAKNNSNEIFKAFIKRIEQENNIKIKPIQNQSGIIPIFNPKQKTFGSTASEHTKGAHSKGEIKYNLFLLGDAATQVKATSYGGIIHGLIAAQCIADKINKKKKYEKSLNQKVNKDLRYALLIRKVLNRFTADDYNQLINYLSKKDAKTILEEYDRDFPSKFAFKLFLAQPKLIRFVKKLI